MTFHLNYLSTPPPLCWGLCVYRFSSVRQQYQSTSTLLLIESTYMYAKYMHTYVTFLTLFRLPALK